MPNVKFRIEKKKKKNVGVFRVWNTPGFNLTIRPLGAGMYYVHTYLPGATVRFPPFPFVTL